jgi:hypothetical protein
LSIASELGQAFARPTEQRSSSDSARLPGLDGAIATIVSSKLRSEIGYRLTCSSADDRRLSPLTVKETFGPNPQMRPSTTAKSLTTIVRVSKVTVAQFVKAEALYALQ